MKKNKKNKKAWGTSLKDYIQSPGYALEQNDINIQKAKFEAMTDPSILALDLFSNILMQVGGNQGVSPGKYGKLNINENQANWINKLIPIANGASNLSLVFGYGGNTGNSKDFEVEGGEVAELPNGELLKFLGKDHEQGGIDVNLPSYTNIFSKRIKKANKTLAKRKEDRAKSEKDAMDRFNKSQSVIDKKSFERLKEKNLIEEAEDLKLQEFFNAVLKQPKEIRTKAPYGFSGYPQRRTIHGKNLYKGLNIDQVYPDLQRVATYFGGDVNLDDPYSVEAIQFLIGMTGKDVDGKLGTTTLDYLKNYKTEFNNPEPLKKIDIFGDYMNRLEKSAKSNEDILYSDMLATMNPEKVKLFKNIKPDFLSKAGNTSTYLGDIISTFGSLYNTLQNRAGDKPHTNPFLGYGEEGLQSMDKVLSFLDEQKGEQISNLNLERNALVKRNRNSATSNSVARAGDIAADTEYNRALGEVYGKYGEVMANVFSQIAQLENQQDSMQMQGEYMRETAAEQARDNFFTQKGLDYQNIGYGLQNIGKNLNQSLYNETMFNLLNELSPYATITPDGKFKLKDNPTEETNTKNENVSGYSKQGEFNKYLNDFRQNQSTTKFSPIVIEKINSKEFILKGEKIVDKQGYEIDPNTGKRKLKETTDVLDPLSSLIFDKFGFNFK